LEECTFIIKTFLRPQCAHRLIDSILSRFPSSPILVADDSPAPISREEVTVFHLPYDCGISYGRNFLLDRVETPFLVNCDDDVVLTDQTDLGRLLEPVSHNVFDLVASHFINGDTRLVWEGIFDRKGDVLSLLPDNRGEIDGILRYDMCHNFFAARTDRIRDLRWDNDLKVGEHTDFFLRAKGRLRVGVNPTTSVLHLPESTPEYQRFRSRLDEFRPIFMQKHGLRVFRNEIHPDGSYELSRVSGKNDLSPTTAAAAFSLVKRIWARRG
jgi:Glycosyl transferase family 2